MASDIEHVDLEYAKRVCNCLPFADADAGVKETQACMTGMIAELTRLRERVADLERKLGVAVESVSHAQDEISKITDNEYEGERTRLREVQNHLLGTLYAINPPDESDAAGLGKGA